MIRDSAAIRALCWSWCQLYVFLIQVNFLHSTGVLLSAASRSLASELCHQRGKSLSPSVLIFTVLGRDSNWLGLGPMFNPGSIIATKISKCKKIATLIWITCYNIKRDGGKKLFPQMKEALFPEGRGAWLTNKYLLSTYYVPESTFRSRSHARALSIFRNLVENFGIPQSMEWGFKPILTILQRVWEILAGIWVTLC